MHSRRARLLMEAAATEKVPESASAEAHVARSYRTSRARGANTSWPRPHVDAASPRAAVRDPDLPIAPGSTWAALTQLSRFSRKQHPMRTDTYQRITHKIVAELE